MYLLRVTHQISAHKRPEVKDENGAVVSAALDIPALAVGDAVEDDALIKALQESHPAHVVRVNRSNAAPAAPGLTLPETPALKA